MATALSGDDLKAKALARRQARQSGQAVVNAQPVQKSSGDGYSPPSSSQISDYYSQPVGSGGNLVTPQPKPTSNPQTEKGFDLEGAGNPVYKTEDELVKAYESQQNRRGELQDQLDRGEIRQEDYDREVGQMFTDEQYQQGIKVIGQYGTGVDPLGFFNETVKGNDMGFANADEARSYYIGTYDENGNFVPSEEYLKNGGQISPQGESTIYNLENNILYKGAANPDAPGLSPSQKAQLRDPNAPLGSIDAGAMGKGGAIGYNPRRTVRSAAQIQADLQTEIDQIDQNFQELIQTGTAGPQAATIAEQKKAGAREQAQLAMEALKLENDGSEAAQVGSVDTGVFNQSSQQVATSVQKSMDIVTSLLNNDAGVSETVSGAYMSSYAGIMARLQSIQLEASRIDTPEERASLAATDDRVTSAESLAARREASLEKRLKKDKEFLRENRDILVEANRLSKESLELDKQIMEEQQRISEIRKMSENVEKEKRLRRSLNSVGVENSPEAQQFLQTKIDAAADELESMLKTNNLTKLKYNNARKGLDTELRSILLGLDNDVEKLNAQFDENIFNVDEYVDGIRGEVVGEIRDDWEALVKQEDKLYTEAGEKIEAARIKALEEQKGIDDQIKETKDSAWDRMVEAFETFPPGSKMRDIAIKNARDAGWETDDIDINELTLDDMQKSTDEKMADLWDWSPYVGDSEKFGLITSAQAIANLAVKDQIDNQYRNFKRLIDQGETEKAISAMKNFATSQMTAGIKKSYTQRQTIVKSTKDLLIKLDKVNDTGQAKALFDAFGETGQELNRRAEKVGGYENLTEADFNWYTKEWQNLRNKFGVDKDPALQEVFAEVENIAGIIINERYGAAVTDGEMARAREYIAMSGNTLEDMKTKLRVFAKFSAEQNRDTLSTEGLNLDFLIEDFDADLPLMDDRTPTPTDSDLEKMMQEMDEDFSEMGAFQYEGRTMVSKDFGGRRVVLDQPVMVSFVRANAEFKEQYGTDIKIGAVATSSFRSQEETIKSMAERAGIPFNENNPNVTAKALREKGIQVADVGASKHENGEAIDLYPFDVTIAGKKYTPAEYIELVKPFLEKHNIVQANHQGRDPGNFEYQTV